MSKKINFKVSARTARLIGRENVSNAESALIELVKNAYDADAEYCVIYFDNNNRLHILDDGHGMTDDVIENHWMTIGTNNKEKDYITNSGRIKSGEKGIGRFALDRLGQRCELWTKPIKSNYGYIWEVNWKDFENDVLETVEQIEAELTIKPNLKLENRASDIFDSTSTGAKKILKNVDFSKGTFIQVHELRDDWELFRFKRLYKSLSTLIPPKEEASFDVYLYVEEYPHKFGKVDTGPCDDFDYKISADINEKQEAIITITRNEYDLDRLDNDLFKRKAMSTFPYDKKTFYNKTFELKKTLSELLPGFAEQDKNNILNKIGPFSFTFYFMKKGIASGDVERFFYKEINAKIRRVWLEEYGGIKVFRDDFRVRPYGELKGNSLDWLGLGVRYSGSPAGVARKGDWRVREYNLSGVTTISRVKNPMLRDKSSREGIRDNQEFDIFKQLLIGIIHVFEYDRSYIQSELKALYEQKKPKEKIAIKAAKISLDLDNKKTDKGKEKSKAEKGIEVLAQHTKNQEETIQELLSELRILRVLASSGSMFAAFGHELHAVQDEVTDRAATLRDLFEPYLDPGEAQDSIPDEFNPWVYVDEIEELDNNLLHWMQFALSGLRKDKRNRRVIHLEEYFESLEDIWISFLDEREITLDIKTNSNDHKLKAFEVELDTIFNNLILNSVEVFSSKKVFKERKITITNISNEDQIKIHYNDTGTGLSKDIDEPNKVFDLYYSTKRDPNTGEEVGTGIGMYLVKSIINEYGGNVSLDNTQQGFSLIITIPKNSK